MRGILVMAILALAIGVLVPKLYSVEKPANAMIAQVEPTQQQTSSNSRSVTLTARNGHFFTDASIDGRRIEFMVDTGASTIALRERDAARLGIHPAQREGADWSRRILRDHGDLGAGPEIAQVALPMVGRYTVSLVFLQ